MDLLRWFGHFWYLVIDVYGWWFCRLCDLWLMIFGVFWDCCVCERRFSINNYIKSVIVYNYIGVWEANDIVCFFPTEMFIFFPLFHLNVMVCFVDICHSLWGIKLCSPHSYTTRKCVLQNIHLENFLTKWTRILPSIIDSVVITSLNHDCVYKITRRRTKNNIRWCKGWKVQSVQFY